MAMTKKGKVYLLDSIRTCIRESKTDQEIIERMTKMDFKVSTIRSYIRAIRNGI